jgi:hypothetical protein
MFLHATEQLGIAILDHVHYWTQKKEKLNNNF